MNNVPDYQRLRGRQPDTEYLYEFVVRPRSQPRRSYLVDDALESMEQLAVHYKELYEIERRKNGKDWRLDAKSIEDMFIMLVQDGNSTKLLMVKPTDYVRDVKLQFKMWWQTGSRELIIQYGNTILEDNKTLEQHGINTHCRVNLVSDQESEKPIDQPTPNGCVTHLQAQVSAVSPPNQELEARNKILEEQVDQIAYLQAQVNSLSASNQELEARNKTLKEQIDKYSIICTYCKSTQ